MKWFTVVLVLVVAMPATAALMAYANWDEGPEGWSGYGDLNHNAGFDWLRTIDASRFAVTCFEFELSDWPDADGVGKWGGGLYDEPDVDAGLYVQVNDPFGGPDCLADDQGTIEFWFKPDWNPATDTNAHAFIKASTGVDWDGLRISFNGDGSMTTQMLTQESVSPEDTIDVGHEWTTMPLVQDWNHIAFVWDEAGNRSYCNGGKVGETVYDGPAPNKVNWGDWHLVMLGQEGNWTGDYQSEGTWDAMAIWSDPRYTGDTYSPPTEPPHVTAVDGGDADGDGFVGQGDLDIVLGAWGTSPPADPRADLFVDDFVGQADLNTVLSFWGQGTPPATSVPEPATLGILAVGGTAIIRRRRT